MKSIRFTIWFLLAFIVIATLDSQPDPPAINPSICKVLLHDCSCAGAALSCDSVALSSPSPVSSPFSDAIQPYRPSVRMILTVLAADPSPPSLQAARKLTFQS